MSEREVQVRELLAAITRNAPPQEITEFWHPDAVQVEYPSVMRPRGHSRGLAEMLEGYHAGADLLRRQEYDVLTVLDDGDRLAVQLTWRATTAVEVGALPPGSDLVAHVAVFYEFRDGKILRQSSYDCYEPLPV